MIRFSTEKIFRYHFNEPVRGNVILQYFIECSFTYYCQENKASVIRNLKLDQNGCVDHEITIKNLSSFAQNVLVNASVIEEGTRMRVKAVAKMSINNLRKKNVMEFSVETKKRKFKPGLPFKGEVSFLVYTIQVYSVTWARERGLCSYK